MNAAAEALRRARARIADPHHWIRGASMQDAHGDDTSQGARDARPEDDQPGQAVKFCAVGAVEYRWSRGSKSALDLIEAEALATDPTVKDCGGSYVAAYNDRSANPRHAGDDARDLRALARAKRTLRMDHARRVAFLYERAAEAVAKLRGAAS